VRIYTEPALRTKLRSAGLRPRGAHHAHGIHAPYWWLKCAVGPTNDDHPRVWDIAGTRPWHTLTRLADRVLTPVIGKSIVVYAHKPPEAEPEDTT
jgi:hypothetical protein